MSVNTGATIIKQLLVKNNMTIKELSQKLGYSTPQVLSNKLHRDKLPLNEYIRIVNALGGEVKTFSKDNSISFVNQFKE